MSQQEWPQTDPTLGKKAAKEGIENKVEKPHQSELFLKYHKPVENFLRILGVDPSSVDDGVQVVFMKVFRALPNREGLSNRSRSFRAFMKEICRNWVIDEYRKKQKRTYARPISDEELAQIEVNSASESTCSLYREWLEDTGIGVIQNLLKNENAKLTNLQQVALRGFMNGKSLRQIGTEIGENHQTVSRAMVSVSNIIFKEFLTNLK